MDWPRFFTACPLDRAGVGNPFEGAKSGARDGTPLSTAHVDALDGARRAALAEPARHLCRYFGLLLTVLPEDVQLAGPSRPTTLIGEAALVAFSLAAMYEAAGGDAWACVATPLALLDGAGRATMPGAMPLLDERVRAAGVLGGWRAIAGSVRLVTLLAHAEGAGARTLWALADEIETLGTAVLANPAPCADAAGRVRRRATAVELASPDLPLRRRFLLLCAQGAAAEAALVDFVFATNDDELNALFCRRPSDAEVRTLLSGGTPPVVKALPLDEAVQREIQRSGGGGGMTVTAPRERPPPSSSSKGGASRFIY